MQDLISSTAAILRCAPDGDLNFAHIVGEMEKSLSLNARHKYQLIWENADEAIFDFQSTRIVLAVSDLPEASTGNLGTANCLLVSVGAPPANPMHTQPYLPYNEMCAKIVQQVCDYYRIDTVTWQEVDGCVTSELAEQLLTDFLVPLDLTEREKAAAGADGTDRSDQFGEASVKFGPETPFIPSTLMQPTLPNALPSDGSPPADPDLADLPGPDLQVSPRSQPKGHADLLILDHPRPRTKRPVRKISLQSGCTALTVANDAPDLPGPDQGCLNVVREVLYAKDMEHEAKPSAQIRLSATAIDVTLIIVCLPVGAAMLTYHLFRGGEMRHSAQMLTLTGLAMVFAKSPFGHQLLSIL